MLCQNCNINEATIHLYTSVNGQKKQIDLCQNCYQIMKSGGQEALFGAGNASNGNSDEPFNPFNDIFSALMEQQALKLHQHKQVDVVRAVHKILGQNNLKEC